MTDAEKQIPGIVERELKAAWAAHGQIGKTDVEVLALALSNQRGMGEERREVMRLNAWQAQRIAELEGSLKRAS